ncbi:hypothetical protein [Streptomyces noursei]|uniref:hypothetical protein n=1 Tax=Streptomyces noursei TaxID=1971 RepID=UPI0023B83FCC|nr:hypothetical protein [Streptomyces noursei]
MVGGLADVQAEGHAHVSGAEHPTLPGELPVPASASVAYACIHVARTAAREPSGVMPDGAVAGLLISVSGGTPRVR